MKAKQMILTAILLTISLIAKAQWTTSGTNIYYNAPNGRVGIGTSSPTQTLTVKGKLSVTPV